MTRPKNDPLPETCRGVRGTIAGYGRHKRRGESACPRCREAINRYNRERRHRWESVPTTQEADLLRRKARARAWAALQRRHPNEYAAILRVEMGRLLAATEEIQGESHG